MKTPEEMIEALLSEDDKAAVQNGQSVRFGFQIDTLMELPKDVQKGLEKLVDTENICMHLDIRMYKKIDLEKYAVTKLPMPLRFTIHIPEEYRKQAKGRAFAVVRLHEQEDGTIVSDILPDLDQEDSTITFETDQFSVFTLIYDEPKNPSENSDQETKQEINQQKGVDTGDHSHRFRYALYMLMSFLAMNALGCIALYKKLR